MRADLTGKFHDKHHRDLDMLVYSSSDSHESSENVVDSVDRRVIEDPKVNAGRYRLL